MNKLVFGCSCSVAALLAAPAMGQVVPGPGTNNPPVEQAEAEQEGLEEIVVTAQRRSERQQDVPIAISTVTALSAERQGATGTESLGLAVPSLQFSRQTGNGGAPFVRGVGSQIANAGTESPVAVYVDDVYIGAPNSTLFQFNNIESVEVLKGPQGTLFGRNATGGVIHVHTKKPSHNAALDATFGFGSYDTYYGSVYMTGGVTDTVAVNFAATGHKQAEGYGFNLITGEDTLKNWNYGFRGQLLWEPDTATSFLLSGDYSRKDGDVGMSVFIAPGTVGSGGGTFVHPFGTYDSDDSAPGESYGLSGKLTHDFDAFRFVGITAARYNAFCLILDVDGSAGLPIQKIGCAEPPKGSVTETFSQEIQLLSPEDSALTWILGGFYYRSDVFTPGGTTQGTSVPGGFRVNPPSSQKLDSFAVFGDASYEFIADTTLTAGVRYTVDERHRTTSTVPSDSTSFSKITYRGILDHKFTPDLMVYASVSRGFKSGGFNNPLISPTGVITIPPPIDPETLDAYEIGVKSQWFDNTLRVNASAFHYDYSNLQVAQIVAGNNLILNAASARIRGADLDWNFVPNSRINLSGAFAILDARFKDFPAGPLFVPRPAVCTPVPMTTGPLTGGNLTCSVDLSGNRPPRSPEFTMNLSGTYTLPTEVGDFALNTSLYYNSGYFWEPDNRFTQPSYYLLSATLSWRSPDDKYEFKIYGRNLLNEYYYDYYSEGGLRDAGSAAMPRNYGASFGVHF